MKAFNKKKLSSTALALAFFSSFPILCLDAIPAFAEGPANAPRTRRTRPVWASPLCFGRIDLWAIMAIARHRQRLN